MEQLLQSRLALLGHPLRVAILRLLIAWLPRPMSAGEIAQALGVAPSTLSPHLAALSGAGLLALRRDRTLRFYHAVPDALGDAMAWLSRDLALGRAGAGPAPPMGLPRLLFLCPDNAALSLVAEAAARRAARGRVQCLSAGADPAGASDPLVAALLRAQGHGPGPLHPKPVLAPGGAEIVIALGPGALDALPTGWEPLPLFCCWPLPPPRGGRLIPRAVALHQAYLGIGARVAALCRLPLARLPRVALQAALDDLSSDPRATGRGAGSRPAPLRNGSSPGPRASAAS